MSGETDSSTARRTPRFGVQAEPFGDGIAVGRLNKAGTRFLDHHQATEMVLGAVATWVEQHYDGAARVVLGDKVLLIEVAAADRAPAESSDEARAVEALQRWTFDDPDTCPDVEFVKLDDVRSALGIGMPR